jgi:transcriptional regulator with XRE-family HTH domain
VSETLGSHIAKLREKAGWSQRKLGELVGISHVSIQNWEKGSSTPNSLELLRMADLFNVSTDFFLGRYKNMNYHGYKAYIPTEVDQMKLADIISVAAAQIKKVSEGITQITA